MSAVFTVPNVRTDDVRDLLQGWTGVENLGWARLLALLGSRSDQNIPNPDSRRYFPQIRAWSEKMTELLNICPICCREVKVSGAQPIGGKGWSQSNRHDYCSWCWGPLVIRTNVVPFPYVAFGKRQHRGVWPGEGEARAQMRRSNGKATRANRLIHVELSQFK